VGDNEGCALNRILGGIRPKKVIVKVILATAFPVRPECPRGGVESVSVNLVKAFDRLPDVELHIVTVGDGRLPHSVANWGRATVHRLPGGKKGLLRYVTGGGHQFADYIRNLAPDVVHAHDWYGIVVTRSIAPTVFTVHGFIHEDTRYQPGLSGTLRSILWKRVELASWRRQRHVIAISPYVRERISSIVTGVIHDIENPVSEEYFRVQSPLDGTVVFSSAAICERKNQIGLVEALKKLLLGRPTVRLRLAGNISDFAYGQRLKEYIRRNNLSENVDILGEISAEHVRAELAQASVFALPSFEEGAPMGIAEAMAGGLPIVTSNRCGMPYMVRDGEAGFLVSPSNPAEIADRLQVILDDRTLRRSMGEYARRFAVEHFHPNRVATRTMAVYQRAILERENREQSLP
jgi:glycosyltransferase involved in cell wall biosynthesis